MKILLASGSPRRAMLLAEMGMDFRVLVTNVSESIDENTPASLVSERIAERKALAASKYANDDEFVIAADTSVVVNEKIFGKPQNKSDAKQMLTALSGICHTVYTGVAVIHKGKTVTAHEATAVEFDKLDDELIEAYIATKEPFDKAGAYGIQGYGRALVKGIKGDYFNVMGLPLNLLFKILKDDFGISPLSWLK